MNAVEHLAGRMTPEAIRRLAALAPNRFDRVRATKAAGPLDVDAARARILERWGDDLCGLLNALSRGELAAAAESLRIDATGRSPELRARLWDAGAALERGGGPLDPALQPRPILLGGHLVICAPARGMAPDAHAWPRPVPAPRAALPPAEEPDSLYDLLAAADALLGVRLGPRGRDKGAWGTRAAALLGLVESGRGEPDWRGDVEVKTVPIAREDSGHWGVVEDPAIAMVGEAPLAKLQRTLWLARTSLHGDEALDGSDDATIVCWYLLDWDDHVARLTRRYLHERPKGPRGTQGRGYYLSKRFFADAGMLAALNGVS